MVSHPVESTATCQLLDGRLISLRRLDTDDAEAVVALHQHLSDQVVASNAPLDEVTEEFTRGNRFGDPQAMVCAVVLWLSLRFSDRSAKRSSEPEYRPLTDW